MRCDRPTPRAVAAAALVALPRMWPDRLSALLDRWPDPVDAIDAVRDGRAPSALESVDASTRSSLRCAWRAALDLDRAEGQLAARGTRVLVVGDPDFPLEPALPDRPAVLLYEGDRPEALAAPCVAVVGTRAATPHGLDDARSIGAALAEAGVTVVSGMAIGIDGASHQGAIDAGGPAVGVLATGLDVVYPRRHELLYRRVRRAGVVLTERNFGAEPRREAFPVRNRIIAGLAPVTVVVEATRRGGARITADLALAYGRDVFAVPGSRRNPSAAGCNALIADGAHPLLDPSDVLIALGMNEATRKRWQSPARPELTGDAAAVHRALGGEPATCDQLVSRTGLTGPKVSVAVAALERAGRVTRSRGMVWPR